MSFSKILKSDFIKNTLDKAQSFISEDRQRYKQAFDVVEKYCREHHLFLSDKKTLLGIKHRQDTLDIYCQDTFNHAITITNTLHEKISEKLIVLKTVKKNEEMNISIDTRPLFNFYSIRKFKNIEPEKIICPIEIKGTLYLPPEVELIQVYNNLYDLSKFGEKERILAEEESQLYELTKDRLQSTITSSAGRFGGADCHFRRKERVNLLKLEILRKMITGDTDYIITGIWGAAILLKGTNNLCGAKISLEKIQVISQVPLDQILRRLADLCPGIKITMKERELHLPMDFRTTRTTFYARFTEAGVDKPFMDVFNSTSFELVPYSTTENIAIAGKYVLLKFLFIDFWLLKMVTYMNLVDVATAKQKSMDMRGIIDKIRASVEPIYKYAGVYRDYAIDKKIQARASEYHNEYMPEKYLRSHGTLYSVYDAKKITGGAFFTPTD